MQYKSESLLKKVPGAFVTAAEVERGYQSAGAQRSGAGKGEGHRACMGWGRTRWKG